MLDFCYENQTKLLFGRNALEQLGLETKRLGNPVLIVYGGQTCVKNGVLDSARSQLEAQGIRFFELKGVQPNPKMSLAYEGISICKREGVRAILALGGGSVIDTAKTVAMGACYDGDAWDFFSGFQALRTLPVGVVLTIPAAGSESSMDAVMTLDEKRLKRASCAAPFIRPRFAIMDPQLTFTLPASQTAYGACDIIAHVLERYFTPTPDVDTTDRLCEALVMSVMRAAKRAIACPTDYAARAELMLCGTYAHNNMVGVGRVQDWASHGMGHEISALTGAAHGATLAVMMPAWMEYVCSDNVARFAQFANRVFQVPYMPGEEEQMAREGIRRFRQFLRQIGLPQSLRELGVRREDIAPMARSCHRAGNLVVLDEDKIAAIYEAAYDGHPSSGGN